MNNALIGSIHQEGLWHVWLCVVFKRWVGKTEGSEGRISVKHQTEDIFFKYSSLYFSFAFFSFFFFKDSRVNYPFLHADFIGFQIVEFPT